MLEKSVNASGAFELMFELLKARPWLVKPASTAQASAQAEAEALAFLAAGSAADGWGNCGPVAQGVIAWEIAQFMAYLRQQEEAHANTNTSWKVPAHLPAWQQGWHLLAERIARRSPPRGSSH